ncbi:hypothetical protein RIF29_10816 [Crotalaria pallida]|uniref:Secreted protein n=1 Tax=Crotalaria pallida TaxID=3830 RepID=A0AAN9IKW0_CROPI
MKACLMIFLFIPMSLGTESLITLTLIAKLGAMLLGEAQVTSMWVQNFSTGAEDIRRSPRNITSSPLTARVCFSALVIFEFEGGLECCFVTAYKIFPQ